MTAPLFTHDHKEKESGMSTYTATITWDRQGSKFTDNRYSRAHMWHFDGGASVPASSSPQVVRVPFSEPANVDPEEAFVASLSSCHMLGFLYVAARQGFVVAQYRDTAEGLMAKGAHSNPDKEWVARVVLRPHVSFTGNKPPDETTVEAMHHEAHAECYIANSVRTEVVTQGTWDYQAG